MIEFHILAEVFVDLFCVLAYSRKERRGLVNKKIICPNWRQKEYGCAIFDFDGVILDTEKYHYLAWKDAFSLVGVSLSQIEYDPLRSTGREHIADTVCAAHGRVLTDAERDAVMAQKGVAYAAFHDRLSEADLIPGVRDYLAFLQACGVKTAIASSSKFVLPLLEKFKLTDYFGVILDGNGTFLRKPSPDIFLQAAEKSGVSPEYAVVFEDSDVGIAGARAGGFDAIRVVAPEPDPTILRITDYHELF